MSFDYAIVIHSIHSMLKNPIHSIEKLMNGPTVFVVSKFFVGGLSSAMNEDKPLVSELIMHM